MSSRADKLRRRQHRKDKKRRGATAAEQHSAWTVGSFPAGKPLPGPSPDGFKISDALFAVLGPELETWRDEDNLRKMLMLGIAAWNIALEKGPKRTARLEELVRSMPAEHRDDFRMVMQPLIERKDRLFPDVNRMILDYTLEWRGPNEPYVQVMSTLTGVPTT